jgi:hypothetical protein
VATQAGEPISKCWCKETGCSEPISGGFGAGDGAGGENGCGDVAVTCAGSLCKLWFVRGFVGALEVVGDDVGVSEGLCGKKT